MNDTAKHTPGPWNAEHTSGPTNQYATASTGVWSQKRFDAALDRDKMSDPMDDAWICGIWGEVSPEDIANANLIAAAPDLLEALKLFVRAEKMARDGNPPTGADELIELGDAAIAKAEGRS
ncbi:MAG: hypothetical protein PGN22_03110 [Agrobacterium cavarae]